MAEQCTEILEGPRVPGTRSAVSWRRRCQAKAMRDRAELVGWVEGKCFTHQPDRVRHAIHRQRARERGAA